MEIAYSSAPSGAGKTSQIIRRGCQLAQEHKRVLILQPTKELIAKTIVGELNKQSGAPRYLVFHQGPTRADLATMLLLFERKHSFAHLNCINSIEIHHNNERIYRYATD
jgi:hypothetical protein